MTQSSLAFERPMTSGPQLMLLAGLDPNAASFTRLAAERIGAMPHAHQIEAALLEARSVSFMATIESLAAIFIAQRVQAAGADLTQQAFMAALNPQLRAKVEMHLRRLGCAARAGLSTG